MSEMIALETQIPEDIFLTLQARGLFKAVLAERSRQYMAIRFLSGTGIVPGQSGSPFWYGSLGFCRVPVH